jgi:hypothetical protein
MATTPGDHDVIFFSGSKGLQRSDDNGETWVSIGPSGVATVLPSFASDGGLAVASSGTSGDYVMRRGATEPVTGSGGKVDYSFMVSPEFPSGGSFNPALLVAQDRHTGQPLVLRCSTKLDCGDPTVLPWPADAAGVMAVQTVLLPSSDYAEHGSVFAATPFGISKSIDGGATFTPIPVSAAPGASTMTTPMMALAPGYREAGPVRTAYVAVFAAFMSKNNSHTGGGVYRTKDGGASWTALTNGGLFAGGAQAVAAASDGRLFAGYYDDNGHAGLVCSTDGASWQPSCPAVGTSGGSKGGTRDVRGSSTACPGCPATGSGGSGSVGGSSGGSGGGSSDQNPGAAPAGAQVDQRLAPSRRIWPWILLGAGAGLFMLTGGVWGVRRVRSRWSDKLRG